MLELELEGLDKLYNKFGEINGREFLVAPMEGSLDYVVEYMSDYSLKSKKPNPKRTGTLGRRWLAATPKLVSGGVEGEVGNNTSYGPFVQSYMFQARWHKGYWQTDFDAITELDEQINSLFNEAIAYVLGK